MTLSQQLSRSFQPWLWCWLYCGQRGALQGHRCCFALWGSFCSFDSSSTVSLFQPLHFLGHFIFLLFLFHSSFRGAMPCINVSFSKASHLFCTSLLLLPQINIFKINPMPQIQHLRAETVYRYNSVTTVVLIWTVSEVKMIKYLHYRLYYSY